MNQHSNREHGALRRFIAADQRVMDGGTLRYRLAASALHQACHPGSRWAGILRAQHGGDAGAGGGRPCRRRAAARAHGNRSQALPMSYGHMHVLPALMPVCAAASSTWQARAGEPGEPRLQGLWPGVVQPHLSIRDHGQGRHTVRARIVPSQPRAANGQVGWRHRVQRLLQSVFSARCTLLAAMRLPPSNRTASLQVACF